MTQTHDMDCSDGAKMLIERMQTHPEDFNYGGKLYRVLDVERLSVRDLKAYNDAHDKYIKEPTLMVSVLQALLAQPEEEEIGMTKFKTQGRYAFGQAIPKSEVGSVFDPLTHTNQQRITREMYEDHIQTHKELIKAKAIKQPTPSKLSDIYNKALGRERIERDN